MRHEENIDDLDDPITLYDCSNLLDAGIVEPETLNSEKAVQHNLKYKLSLKSCYMLPVSFFDIPRNISLLDECQPVRVTLVDYYKHPRYLKNNRRQSIESNETDSTIHIASDNDDSDIICLDSKIPSYLLDANKHADNIDLTSNKNKKCAKLSRRRRTLNDKLDLELQKALSQKYSTNIDFKRNKGLVGIKITRRITVDDTAQDANNDIEHCYNNNNHKNDDGNINHTKINDTDTYINSVDKMLQRVGTAISPILEVKDSYVSSTVNNNQLETKPPTDNNNKPKSNQIRCQLTNIPQNILAKVLKLKEAPKTKVNREQIPLNKAKHNTKDTKDKCMTPFNKVHIMGSKLNNDLKTSEISSAVNPNKYETNSSCQDECKNIHDNERPKQRPMPKCKKLLENLKIKSREVKEKSVERQVDKTKNEREISGIISPILPCNIASKNKTMFKPSKPHIINEPKNKHQSRNLFEIHKHNIKELEKTLNTQKNIKPKPSSSGNQKDKSKEKSALKLNNTQSKETAIRKECSEIAQKLVQSVFNHETSPQLESVRKKVNSNKQVLSEGQVKPISNNGLKSDSTVNIGDSGEKIENIVSVKNVTYSGEYIKINNDVKTVMAQQNTLSDTHSINTAVKKTESIVLQRPICTETLHQHKIFEKISENISNVDTNRGNNIPTKIPSLINNQASSIILRPQLNNFHAFNIGGQPIQTYTTCRSQYPKVTKYPTLDKLLSKTNYQPVYQVPRLQPSRHFFPPNKNGYQHQNVLQRPSTYYGVAQKMVPGRPVLSNSYGAPNANPYWNYGYPSIIPPPPPPPPVQYNYNPNILTDIQPNDDSSIIGRNVNGPVNKTNINSWTPPSQPEHDTKEGIVKLEPVSPQNASESTGNRSGNVFKTVNSIEIPVGTKSEMLEELERNMLEESPEKTDLKRPHLENSVVNAVPRLPTVVHKVGPLSKKMKPNLNTQSTKQTVTIPIKGYSPPILPIPTYQNFLSQVNSNVQNYVVQNPKDRDSITPCIRHALPLNLNYRKATKIMHYGKECPTHEKPAKKISIADYKKRSSLDTNCLVLTHKVKQIGNSNVKSVIKVFAQSKDRCSNNSDFDMQDLGYNSDTLVKR